MILRSAPSSALVRLFDFLRRPERDALLACDEEVWEELAVHAVLTFVRALRSSFTARGDLGWMSKGVVFSQGSLDILSFALEHSVAPRQLAQNNAQPLKDLLRDATRATPVAFVPTISDTANLHFWAKWLMLILGVPEADDCCCCTRIELSSHGGGPELRLQHGHFPLVRGLEEMPAHVDGRVERQRVSAYAAALAGHVHCLRYLDQTDHDMGEETAAGFTAMHAAAYRDDSACLDFLLRTNRSLVMVHTAPRTPSEVAIVEGRLHNVRAFHRAGFTLKNSFEARVAAQHNQAAVLRFLLTIGADPTASDSRDSHSAITVAAKFGHVDCLRVLHAAGVDLWREAPPLSSAAAVAEASGQIAALEFLTSVWHSSAP